MKDTKQITKIEVKNALPDVFIDYLWSLALVKGNPESSLQVFVLQPETINGNTVQEVLHKFEAHEAAKHYRVFGIDPVEKKVLVYYDGDHHEMALAA